MATFSFLTPSELLLRKDQVFTEIAEQLQIKQTLPKEDINAITDVVDNTIKPRQPDLTNKIRQEKVTGKRG